MPLVIRTLLAPSGCRRTRRPDDDQLDLAHISDKSLDALSLAQLGELLEALRAAAEPLLEQASHSQKPQVADVARLRPCARSRLIRPFRPRRSGAGWAGCRIMKDIDAR